MRSVSLDMNVSPQQPSLQYPIRATSPYTLIQQQQQQGMVGNHSMMANQAGMVNTGGSDAFVVRSLSVVLSLLFSELEFKK